LKEQAEQAVSLSEDLQAERNALEAQAEENNRKWAEVQTELQAARDELARHLAEDADANTRRVELMSSHSALQAKARSLEAKLQASAKERDHLKDTVNLRSQELRELRGDMERRTKDVHQSLQEENEGLRLELINSKVALAEYDAQAQMLRGTLSRAQRKQLDLAEKLTRVEVEQLKKEGGGLLRKLSAGWGALAQRLDSSPSSRELYS